ncbi:MAG: radical SAM protein [Thermoanaerobaculia bacterium]
MISITKLLGGSTRFGDLLLEPADTYGDDSVRTGPPVVVWNSTRTCNLDCIVCRSLSERRHFPGELTTEEAMAMVDDLVAFHTPSLIISGGEPLIRPDMLSIIEYATSQGLRVTLSTNGTLLSGKIARELARAGVQRVGISIDGSEKTHDGLRDRKGAYREAVQGIRNCRDAGVPVGVRFTLTASSADDLGEILQLIEREGVSYLAISHLVYSGHGPATSAMDLNMSERRFVMDSIIDQVEQWIRDGRPIEVVTEDNLADGPYVYLKLLQKDPARAADALEQLKRGAGNRSGLQAASVDSFGNVHPDQFMQYHTIGSIRDRRFSDVWRHTQDGLILAMRDRRKYLKGRCATCLWVDLCNGNFRPRAEAECGDFWEADPACYLFDSEIAPSFVSGAD